MKRLLCIIMLILLLGGCSDDSYLSVRPHDSPRTVVTDTITVENYAQLRNTIVQQVDLHVTQFSMMTYSYFGDVEQDLENAVSYVRNRYPIGAYTVRTLSYDLEQVASYYRISVRISYSHNTWELEQINEIRMDNLPEAIGEALGSSDTHQVLMISAYRDTDFQSYCDNYAARNPEKVMQAPTVTYRIWPDSGSVRIVELDYAYKHTRYELQQMQKQVDEILDAAVIYVSYGRSDAEKAELLHTFLSERFIYQSGQTDTPAYAMLCQGISDSQTYAEIFRTVCQQVGMECYAVDGLKDGNLYKWNIINLDGSYYHADPYAAELQGLMQLPLYTDADMTNYVWDTEQYPASITQ